jgi:hypothetical protein
MWCGRGCGRAACGVRREHWGDGGGREYTYATVIRLPTCLLHAHTHACTHGRTDARTHAHARTHGRTDAWTDGRTDGRTHACTHARMQRFSAEKALDHLAMCVRVGQLRSAQQKLLLKAPHSSRVVFLCLERAAQVCPALRSTRMVVKLARDRLEIKTPGTNCDESARGREIAR